MQELAADHSAGTNGGVAAGANGARPMLTTTSWQAGQELSFADWVDQGRRLGLMGRSAGWWIGDWLQYGNFMYGERYTRAARVTGYDAQTLMNMVYVASRIEPDRRRQKLSWSHHAEVVALSPADQDAWLERAEQEHLSVRCLREGIRRRRRALQGGAARLDRPANDHADGEKRAVVACPSCGHAFGSGKDDVVESATADAA